MKSIIINIFLKTFCAIEFMIIGYGAVMLIHHIIFFVFNLY